MLKNRYYTAHANSRARATISLLADTSLRHFRKALACLTTFLYSKYYSKRGEIDLHPFAEGPPSCVPVCMPRLCSPFLLAVTLVHAVCTLPQARVYRNLHNFK
jgi:hypothetical protein